MKRILLLSFMSLIVAFGAIAQRTVSGKITSAEDGAGIPGVNVVLKGTTTGTTSDLEGNYRLSVPEEGGTLVFSFIGLTAQEVEVGARSVIDVNMQSDVQQLTEVVVTGYGIERAAREITYQTERIDSDALMVGQQTRAAAGMVGKIAGAQINVQDNGVNPQTQILLRGLRSISANNEAMIIIDGAIATSAAFSALNPVDIENINILKSANLGAQYGSRAANGVVVVTTKRGKPGDKFTVGLNSAVTFEQVAFMPEFQTRNGIGWDNHYDRIENTNWGPRFDGQLRPVGPSFPEGYVLEDQLLPYAPIEDNLRDFYETGRTIQNTAYFRGGSENSGFYMSIGHQDVKGIIPDDRYERYMFRVNANTRVNKLSLGLASSFMQDETDVVGSDIGDQDRTLYWFVLNTPANIPLTNYKDWNNPESYAHANNYYNAFYQNPYWAIGTNRDTRKGNRFVGNISADYEILDNLKLSTRVGINNASRTGKYWRDEQRYDEDLQAFHSTVSSFLIDTEDQFTEINGNTILSGSFNLGSNFTFTPMVGAAFINTSYRRSKTRANNLSIPGFYDISNGTGNLSGEVDQTEERVVGFFGDFTFGFKNWAFLNIAGRQDYTSTLPLDNNGYFYPAISASVILTDAIPALQDNDILNFAKLTVSNATVFNDLDPFALNERYSQGSVRDARGINVGFPFPYGAVNGFERSVTTVDPNIKKEKLNNTEVSLSLGFFNDRLNFSGAVYNTKTTDLITFTTPSVASGAQSYLTNIGELESTGAEASVSGTIINTGGFTWQANLNITTYKTVVNEIDPNNPDSKEVTIESFTTYGTFAVEDKVFPQLKAQSYVRDPQGRVVIDPSSGNPLVGDVESHGKVTPDYILGGTTQFGYKGITVSGTFDFRTGHVYYSQGNDAMEFTGRSVESVAANRQNFVWPNSSYQLGDGTYVENENIQTTNGQMGLWQNTYNEIKENYVKDATAFKIRELAVRYDIPQSILSKTKFVDKVTVGFVARNLWVFLPKDQSNFSDPEFRNTRNRAFGTTAVSDDANGIGVGGYLMGPPTRSFGFSLNVEF
ncbi:MAG: SusC/RagA family TonB-linked outer membrane protein [Cyclobacteriaceae bacterium]